MNAPDLVESSAPRPLPMWLLPIAGLLAAGSVACLLYQLPLPHSLSLGELIGSAIERVLGVLLANALSIWGLCAIAQRMTGADRRRLILQTSVNVLWLAPLVLFIRGNSPWAMAITAVLVAGFVKSVRLLQVPELAYGKESPVLCPGSNAFGPLESSPDFWRQVGGAGTTLCAQTGAFAALAGYPLKAALLVGVSSAVWTWSFTKDDNRKSSTSSQFSWRALLTVWLAVVFTAFGLIQYLRPTYGIRGFGMPNFARYAPSPGNWRGQEVRGKVPRGSIMPAAEGDPGVVLLPDKQTHTKLVAPPPLIENALLTSHGSTKPLEIPFEGVYWFFRAPDVHPPRTSRQAHGSPELLDIRSTDRRPLSMEAHENLGSMLDLNCCSRIQIAIRNADRYPETVSLELVLINSTVPGKPSQSLGRTMVTSTRPWRLYDKRSSPASETLTFIIPAHTSIHRFDEMKVVFRLDAARADAGPKIAIDRFVLVPRGL
jgi:hypothetical protein